jgi:Na+-translocating ferredoxin:NAD+ oxidoreductase RnfC subunit
MKGWDMKRLLTAVALVTLVSAAHAQQITCQTYGNITNCTQSGGISSSVSPIPFNNFGLSQAQQAQAEAQLAQAQANAIREQQMEAQRERFKAQVAQASTERLQAAYDKLQSEVCHWYQDSSCKDTRDLALGVMADELQRRGAESEHDASDSQPAVAPAADGASDNQVSSDPTADAACRKLDALNKGFRAGTVTLTEFTAQFHDLMKACDK